MLTLGIETSCDETAVAVLHDEKVLSNIVSSQINIHKKYGGVVPELASREHLKNLIPIIREALASASVSLSDINLVAVTYAPGLIGALLIGVSTANAIAYGLPYDEGLKGITLYPAQILGLADQLGTIERGKIADLIVTDGDPLAIPTQVRYLFIGGRLTPTENKQSRLYEQYRKRPRPHVPD
jgi:predicted amidohydrolase YtcJ